MKMVFTLFLTCWLGCSMGQEDTITIGGENFKAVLLSDDLKIYSASCEDSDFYRFISESVIRYDSTRQIGYLRSYNYADSFFCREHVDRALAEQIRTLLSGKRKRIGILFSMEDKNKEFIGVLSLFKKGKFKKFTRKANELKSRKFSGERISVREYDYYRYAQGFILAKVGDKLSLIPVSRF